MQLYESSPTTSPAPTPRSCSPAASAAARVGHLAVGDGLVAEDREWLAPACGRRGARARRASSCPDASAACSTEPPTAPRSRRRPRSPTRSSSGTRRSRGTSTRPPGRRPSPSPSGCLAAIASIASGGRSAWIPERNVPGHTQLTRIPSRAYSTAATFASWITAAFVAQYGAACDHAVRPETEAVRTIDPDCCVAHDGHRGPDAVDGAEDVDPERALPVLGRQVVDPTVRSEHPGVADQHVEPAEALHRPADDGFDLGDLAHVGRQRLDRAAMLRQAVARSLRATAR